MDTKGLPRYECHKIVHALKIGTVWLDGLGDRVLIRPANDRYTPFEVSYDYWLRHKPKNGGYFVVYEDGYESFSPAEAFESGYTRIPLTDRDDPFPKVYDVSKQDWVRGDEFGHPVSDATTKKG